MRHLNDGEKELIKQIIEKSGLAIDSERKLRKTMESLSTPWYESILYRIATAGSIGATLMILCAAWKLGIIACLVEVICSIGRFCKRKNAGSLTQ